MIKNPISYPGNKNRLIKQIMNYIPDTDNFIDVFCGSGVVGVNSNSKNIYSNDLSKEAIQILKYFYEENFTSIVDSIESIIKEFSLTYTRIMPKGYYKEYKHEGLSLYNKNGYNMLKSNFNKNPSVQKLIVLLIYGFNHYIRFNSNNEFNVPVGKVDFSESIYNNLKIFVNEIKNKNIIFSNKDFRDESLYIHDNAIYYFDPPYLITTAPYNIAWKEKDEYDLLQILDMLNDNNKKFCLSNVLLSNGKENIILKEWSKKYITINLERQYRNANYQKINITDTQEVLIKNY